VTQDPVSKTGVNSGRSVIAAIILSVVGVSAFLILPVLVGAAAIDLALSEKQMGLLVLLPPLPRCFSQASVAAPPTRWH